MKKLLLGLMGFLLALGAFAGEEMLRLPTRPGVTVPVFYMKQAGATATIILLPGGAGGIGRVRGGEPTSMNFLVRARNHFAQAGLNVALMDRPSDINDLDAAARVSPPHLQDIRAVVDHLKADTGLPVWLAGTSRGTISAAAAAVNFGNDHLAGVVLTSSIVAPMLPGSVQTQELGLVRIPVLVVHHEQDACRLCRPAQVPTILARLTNTTTKKLVMMQGGDAPRGDPCEAMHYHGFIGIEKEAVQVITDWIRNPRS